MSIATSLFSIFIHQNTKNTTGYNIYSILEKRPKTLLKVFLINVNRLTLPILLQDVIVVFSILNIHKKQSLYLHNICRETSKKKMSLGDARIMMFYGCPENVNLTRSIQFITIIFSKYCFSVRPGNRKN